MALKKGDDAPSFKADLDNGEQLDLTTISSKYIVLYFYPKDDTPGCTVEACSIRDNLKDIQKLDAVVYGVSKDDTKSHQKFAEKYSLNFPLIIDPKAQICREYDVLKEKSMFGKKYVGIERTTYIIDKNLKIVEVMEKVNPATHTSNLIAKLENLNK